MVWNYHTHRYLNRSLVVLCVFKIVGMAFKRLGISVQKNPRPFKWLLLSVKKIFLCSNGRGFQFRKILSLSIRQMEFDQIQLFRDALDLQNYHTKRFRSFVKLFPTWDCKKSKHAFCSLLHFHQAVNITLIANPVSNSESTVTKWMKIILPLL